MSKIYFVTALMLMLCIDTFLFLGQQAVLDINPDGAPTFHSYDTTSIKNYDTGNNTLVVKGASTSDIPSQGLVDAGDSDIFTDTINFVKKLFTGAATYVGYFYDVISGPVNYIKFMNLPAAFTFAVGAIWYGITLYLIVMVIAGRE